MTTLYGNFGYVVAVIALSLALWVILIRDRRIGGLSQRAVPHPCSDNQECVQTLAEAIPQIIWTAIPGGGIDYVNRRFYDLTGFTEGQTLGWAWQEALHPDDRPIALQNWERVHATGEPFETEYRIRTANGEYRWHMVRATPLRDSAGKIAKWFGACVDIDDQMSYQQKLEDQIKRHTAALMEANSRLEMEMRERALTQQELNLQSERMVRELTKRSNRLTNLAKMAELLQGCSELKDAFSVIAGMAPKVFPELRGALLLFNASREALQVATSWADCALAENSFDPHQCWALRTGRTHIVASDDHTAKCAHVPAGLPSYCCLPLMAHGELLGGLHFQMIEAAELPQPIVLIAKMFADQVALSLANIRLRQALRNQSIRDPLTGLYNRRYLEEVLDREMRRAVRSEQSLGVLMLDLDHFKRFNDTYGHDAGDAILRETAALLLKGVRAEDIVCRFGGEEFLIILPAANLRVSHTRAERIRTRLRELRVIHEGQSLGTVTVSVGVAELPQHGTSPKELIDAADAALYRAKKEGRDRVVTAIRAVPETLNVNLSGADDHNFSQP